ncbi:His Kinase A (phospho-acceptor) domain-containing protein [Filimonas lacunae]|uniref:histidine kinase n=1 Tax=Filimonas lacunae TaxID=477680 RepID=A0A173MFR9_9BACT|nr:HAMP domain-containing sensor histidine kinase [Filimonas lacunae]BAV06281.1 sensory box sensor histidine kinase/response regulator [Filimonas lacunae]SIT25640.1 His Kinase A (phospho-acceptor) domain-containing protein [Filimonas lacunae]
MTDVESIIGKPITSPLEEEGKQRWHIVRLICGFTSVLVVLYGLLFFMVSRELLILVPAFIFCVMFLGVMRLTARENYRLTGFLLQLVFCSVMIYYGIVLGNTAQVQYLSIFMISISALLFRPDDKRFIYASALLPVICLGMLELNYNLGWFPSVVFTYRQDQVFRWLILFVVILLNFLLLSLHQTKLVGLLRKSRELYFQLNITNQQLRLQAEQLEHQVLLRTEELNRLVQQLQGANRLKTAFLQENNHEVRNPVNSILGFTDRLIRHKRKPFISEQEELELLECIYSSSQHLRNIVSNVLDYSRLEAGKDIRLSYETFPCKEWLEQSVFVYEVMARERKVKIHRRIDDSLPDLITTDKTRLTQILFNLVGNAMKFTPRHKNIYIHCWQEEGWFMIKIRDEGVGIAAKNLESIFNDYETNDYAGGVGLGLGIVKKLTQLLNGQVEVSSVEGEGSMFKISIPMNQRAPE